MKKDIYIPVGRTFSAMFSRCDSLDIEPTSSLAGTAYWKKPGPIHCVQYRGLHVFTSRKVIILFFLLGEPSCRHFYGDNLLVAKQAKAWNVYLSIP